MKSVALDPLALNHIESALKKQARRTIPSDSAGDRRAAVLLSLCHVNGEPSVLFTKRADDVPTHKGQVSFPGGMEEQEDSSVIATALRETGEELGLSPDSIRILGVSHDLQAITGVLVTTVIGYLGEVGDPEALPFEKREIAQVFALSFPQIFEKEKRRMVHADPRGSYPVFEGGPWPVWGLTAYILNEFIHDILGIELWS